MVTDAMSYQRRLVASHPQWWLGLMLLALQAASAWGIESFWSRAFLLVHFGLFLLWQPVWRGERNLKPAQAAAIIVLAVVLVFWNNWWLVAAWLAVLFALIGGSVPGTTQRNERLVSLIAALYLLALLLVWVVPHLFLDQKFDNIVILLVRYGLLPFPVLVIALKVDTAREKTVLPVDLFYSLMLFLLVVALVLGSFVVKMLSEGDYAIALTQALFGIAVVLVVLSWLWNPHSGFTGVGHFLSRYLMSMGLPFERWMQNLADRAEWETQPNKFLLLALEDMVSLPWVAGIAWRTTKGAGELGERSKNRAEFSFQDLTLVIYTRPTLSLGLRLHLKLLTQLLGNFYYAKHREMSQRQNAYTQAIYETGARLTHDVKNLLQSLRSLCAAMESSTPDQAQELQNLMRSQLPQITERLQNTLEKLKAPQQVSTGYIGVLAWWEDVKGRYGRGNINFTEEKLNDEIVIPAELFDSVADNLLQNALNKGKMHTDLHISVTFSCANKISFCVCDDGDAIKESVAAHLFEGPVFSKTGLGIGLYQAAQQAHQLGYRLTLANNENRKVCFELSLVETKI